MGGASVLDNSSVHEYTPVDFQCSATGYPPPFYRWFYTTGNAVGRTVILKFNRTFTDENISCDLKQTFLYENISCEVTNTYYLHNGTTSAFSTTSITYLKLNILS
ncbi:hypothetical protein DPMN_139878 [Dreissena polymorpha]|uniref:Ig-like domain-containing protein n=1 Tax=Dreissena polymorpha TaxID=45954 RepID=A0A9D4G9X0_DREPO|nr:hypothetical protein DPMN_139878 [Dreissena polymorpha]